MDDTAQSASTSKAPHICAILFKMFKTKSSGEYLDQQIVYLLSSMLYFIRKDQLAVSRGFVPPS
jgi:hypothetical protein